MISEDYEEGKVTDELKKLASIAVDMELAGKMRTQAIDQLGEMASHESMLVLLNLAANDKMNINERERALKRAGAIIKKGR